VFAGLLQLDVLVQFYFAGVGAFARPQDDKSFALHEMNGWLVFLLSLLLLIVAALAKAPGRLVGLSALPLGLTVLQVLLVLFGRAFNDTGDHTTPAGLVILGLHAVNGLAIMAVVGILLRRARLLTTGRSPGQHSDAPAPVV
jgi:energy-coupling factor transporter transmembrane protein EcfT